LIKDQFNLVSKEQIYILKNSNLLLTKQGMMSFKNLLQNSVNAKSILTFALINHFSSLSKLCLNSMTEDLKVIDLFSLL